MECSLYSQGKACFASPVGVKQLKLGLVGAFLLSCGAAEEGKHGGKHSEARAPIRCVGCSSLLQKDKHGLVFTVISLYKSPSEHTHPNFPVPEYHAKFLRGVLQVAFPWV